MLRPRLAGALRRQRFVAAGLLIVVAFAVLAIFAPLICAHPPTGQNLAMSRKPPSREHWFGTDALGRDVFARICYGGRISLLVGAVAVLIGAGAGVPIGLISGYYGGRIDNVIQRAADVLFGFSTMLLALALIAVLGVGIQNVVVAIGLSSVPVFVRLARSQALSIRNLGYVDAAKAAGRRDRFILVDHVLRNAAAPLIVQAAIVMGSTILVAAGLGFLGLGVQPPTAEWGAMLGESRQYIFDQPELMAFPGLAIVLTVFAFNVIGDGFRDVSDPRLDGSSG